MFGISSALRIQATGLPVPIKRSILSRYEPKRKRYTKIEVLLWILYPFLTLPLFLAAP